VREVRQVPEAQRRSRAAGCRATGDGAERHREYDDEQLGMD